MPGVRLALLLEAAVQVAAVDVGAQHALAVELGDDLHRAVRRRVRRPDVDDDRVVAQRRRRRPSGPGWGAWCPAAAVVTSGTARAAARGPSGSPCAADGRRSPRRAGSGAGRRCRGSTMPYMSWHSRSMKRGRRRTAAISESTVGSCSGDARLQPHAHVVLRRVEVVDDLEARRLPGPVDRGHVEEQVEAELAPSAARHASRAARRAAASTHQHAVRDRRRAGGRARGAAAAIRAARSATSEVLRDDRVLRARRSCPAAA